MCQITRNTLERGLVASEEEPKTDGVMELIEKGKKAEVS